MSKKKKEGIVYSTNPDFVYETGNETSATTLSANQQQLFIWLESKGRKGKTVTLVKGFVGHTDDLNDLAGELKKYCGTGGSVKDGEVIIQGNFREKIMAWLSKKGYRVKKAGR